MKVFFNQQKTNYVDIRSKEDKQALIDFLEGNLKAVNFHNEKFFLSYYKTKEEFLKNKEGYLYPIRNCNRTIDPSDCLDSRFMIELLKDFSENHKNKMLVVTDWQDNIKVYKGGDIISFSINRENPIVRILENTMINNIPVGTKYINSTGYNITYQIGDYYIIIPLTIDIEYHLIGAR